jgi:hypothetical protein
MTIRSLFAGRELPLTYSGGQTVRWLAFRRLHKANLDYDEFRLLSCGGRSGMIARHRGMGVYGICLFSVAVESMEDFIDKFSTGKLLFSYPLPFLPDLDLAMAAFVALSAVPDEEVG